MKDEVDIDLTGCEGIRCWYVMTLEDQHCVMCDGCHYDGCYCDGCYCDICHCDGC
jgi:hypothetical protein